MIELRNDYDVSRVVGINSEYYLRKFKYLNASKKIFGWNWGSLFLWYWLCYRKMYLFAFIYYLTIRVIYWVTVYSDDQVLDNSLFAITLIVHLLFISLANYLYFQHVKNILSRSATKKTFTDGVNFVLPVILFLVLDIFELDDTFVKTIMRGKL